MVQRAFKQLRLAYDEGDELIERFFASQGQRNISQAIRHLIYMHVIEYGDADVVGVFAHKCNDLYHGVGTSDTAVTTKAATPVERASELDVERSNSQSENKESAAQTDTPSSVKTRSESTASSESTSADRLNDINQSLIPSFGSTHDDEDDDFGMSLD